MKIKHIEKIETKEICYDIETKKNHNFFANNILIHNSNFGISYDGSDITSQKRNSALGQNAGFYNSDFVVEKYSECVKSYWYSLPVGFRKCLKGITIFGELFGGIYQGMPKLFSSVQKGVEYTNEIEFMAFDILYWFDDGVNKYQSWYELDNLKTFGIPIVPVIRIGTFEDCINESCEFKSRVSDLFNMPECEGENICEGIVVKPIEPKYFDNGERIIIKKKNKKFSERANKTIKVIEELTDEESSNLSIIFSLITENRLRNVISKIGQITQKDFGILMQNMFIDVKEELEKDNKNLVPMLGDKKFKKRINQTLSNLVRSNFTNIIDGEF